MRNCHYWKLAGAKMAPSEIVVFDCETWHADRAAVAGGEFHTLRLGCALAYRLVNGKRTRIQRLTFRVAEAFWDLVWSRTSKQRPVWVFAHNAAYDLGVVGGWKVITGSGMSVEKAAVSGQILYIKCVKHKCGLVFCDTLNYYRCSLRELGKGVGIPKGEMPSQDAPDSDWEAYCRNDVDVTAAGIDALIAFNRKEELGPWQPSIAGLAFSGFRARFMKEKVLVHNYRAALACERESYYGGVVDCPRIGRISAAPIYELDVCSMYPSVCREPVPTVYVDHSFRVGPQVMAKLAQKYMLCGRVTVETYDYPYPVRGKQGTYYPLGRYETCLAHPELLHALHHGHIKWIHFLAWYRYSPIFREYMEHFVSKKSEYRQSGNEAFATICKYFANSLYGKTGQLTPQWQQWGGEALTTLEERYGLAEGTLTDRYMKPPDLYELEEHVRLPEIPEPLEVRDYYGCVEVKTGDSESRDSCPVIAATITSRARMLLREYQRIATSGHWFYCDTDSIWTDETGYTNLVNAGCVEDESLGKLSLKKKHDWLDVWGPKDYETNLVKRLKGIRAGTKPDDKGGWTQLHFPSAAQQIRTGKDGGVFVASVTKHLNRKLTKCVQLPDGTTRPLVFPTENPELKVLQHRRRKVGQ